MPGRIPSVNAGELDRSEARWKYDIEQLFKNSSFVMETKSSIARDEALLGAVFLIGLLTMIMGILWLIKIKM